MGKDERPLFGCSLATSPATRAAALERHPRPKNGSSAPAGEFADAAAPYEENGQLYLDKTPKVTRGPYSDAQPPGRHDFEVEALHTESAFCGQCHNVTNPALNRRDPDTGADMGYLMPVERTYDEWLQSDYADLASEHFASCQRCHMTPPDFDGDGTADPAAACSNPPGLRGEDTALEGPLSTHYFRGGSTFMLEVLAAEYGPALAREASFDAAIAESMKLLTEDTARVDLTLPPSAQPGGQLDALVRVTNLAGHKFPTGYPEGRRAWIGVAAGPDSDGDGTLSEAEITYRSGAYDASTGVLTKDADIKIYEIEVGRYDYKGTGECDIVDAANGAKMFHFVLNDCVCSDNRIPPQGFAPNEETEPVAYTYPENPERPGTLVHWDESDYPIGVPAGAGGPVLVEATLYYQTASKDFIDFLVDKNRSTCDPFDEGCDPTQTDTRLNRSEKMRELWQLHGRSAPVAVANARGSVPLDAGGGSAGEASDPRNPADQLIASGHDPATGEVTISYSPACDASDHAIYWGDLASVSSYAYDDAKCSIGTSGSATFAPGARSVFFLVVGHDGAIEGWYGLDSAGAQRSESSGLAACDLPRDLGQTCMP